jgi:hypothetical protein
MELCSFPVGQAHAEPMWRAAATNSQGDETMIELKNAEIGAQ